MNWWQRLFNSNPEIANQSPHKIPFLVELGDFMPKISQGELNDDNNSYVNFGFHFNDAVFAVVNLVAQVASTTPYKFYRDVNGKYEEVNPADKNFQKLKRLLEKPNPNDTFETLIYKEIASNLVCSESYLYKRRRLTGEKDVYQIHHIPSGACSINWKNELFREVEKVFVAAGTFTETLSPSDLIIRFNANLSSNSLGGKSKLSAVRRGILRSNNAKNASNALFTNTGAVGFLSIEDENTSKEDLQFLEKAYREKHTGVGQQGKIVFTNGKINFQKTSMSAVEMNISQTELTDLRAIASVYGVPSQLVGDVSGSTYSNYKEARKALYTNAVLPVLNNLYAKLSWELINEFKGLEDVFMAIDVAKIPELQVDRKELVEYLEKAYWLNMNEKREAMGLSKIDAPEMDMILTPNNLVAIEYLIDNQIASYEANSVSNA